MREIVFCETCNSNIEKDALFCSNCGEEQSLPPEHQLEKQSTGLRSKKNRGFSKTCVIVAAVSAATAAAVMILG